MKNRRSHEVTIRRVMKEEWRALRELRLLALRSDPLAFGSTLAMEEAFPETTWQERATRGAESLTSSQWVAETHDGHLVGMAVIAEVDGNLHVFSMWLTPEYRGAGVGGGLLDAGLSWVARAHPGRPIQLEVNRRQLEAVRLYESRGFRFTGISHPLEHAAGEVIHEMVRPGRR